MKRSKNALLLFAGGIVLLIAVAVSCKKNSTTAGSAPTITSVSQSSTNAGDTITISGTNLSSATSVKVNGTTATILTNSATTITAVVGAGTTSGTVTVVTAGGTATSSSSITIGSTFMTQDGKTSSNQVEASSLIGYWPFDGTPVEATTSSSPLAPNSGGTITYVTGRIGQAAHFANAWLTYPSTATAAGSNNTGFNSNDTLQNGFTLSLWEEVDTTPVVAGNNLLSTLFQLNTPAVPNWPLLGIQYRRYSDSLIDLDGGLTNNDGTSPYTHASYASAFGPRENDASTWALITMVYDTTGGGSLSYYFNGAQVGTAISLSTGSAQIFPIKEALLMVSPNYATFGSCEATGVTPGDGGTTVPSYMSEGINGNIDDARFFNKTLTATDISDLYQLGLHGQ